MKGLFLDSEKVSPTGNIASQGVINQLGRPSLDLLTVLIREAVQNSWDARSSENGPVQFEIAGRRLDPKARKVLKEIVFASRPPDDSLPLTQLLISDTPISVLFISDRCTIGLGGPTRADLPTNDHEPRDFVDFLRNIGQPPEKLLSGGTYGYGKAAFYRASLVRTICVYTRCLYGNRPESRFMASSLGDAFQSRHVRYTGRHWWGRQEKGIAEPILNEDADNLAGSLGFPVFAGEERGTSILILQPMLKNGFSVLAHPPDDLDTRQVFSQFAQDILWYFWPKMLSADGKEAPMSFRISWQSQQFEIPDPLKYPPLQPFVQAMLRLKGFDSDQESPFRHSSEDIHSQRPAKLLGKLSLQSFPTNTHRITNTSGDEQDHPFFNLTHHTAIMRIPELVVKYVEGPSTGTEMIGYAGVFVTNKEMDSIFASSEPPTHDSWVPDSLEDRTSRTIVRVALREIYRCMDAFSKPPAVHIRDDEFAPLGAFASRLGSSLLPSEQGPSAISDLAAPSETAEEGRTEHKPISEPENLPSDSPFSEKTLPPSPKQLEPSSTLLPPPTYTPPPLSPENSDNTNLEMSAKKPVAIKGRPRVKPVSEGDFVLVGDLPAIQIEFNLKHAQNSSGTVIQVVARAILDGSQTEIEPPIGGSSAQVLYWIAPDGTRYGSSQGLFISSQVEGSWSVIISTPTDIMLGIDFRAEAKPLV